MGSLLDSETILIPQRTDLKSCPPQLAQEIVDEIIDLFSACSDRAAIVPLVTVARAWRPRSQRNLFHTYNLCISKQTLDKALEDRHACSLDVLFSYVRVLQLRRPRTNGEFKTGVWLLHLFTNITELELRGWSFRRLTVNRVACTLGHFRWTVRKLRIVEVKSGAKMLMHFVSLFPLANDTEVRLDISTGADPNPVPVEDRPVARKLQGIFLVDCFFTRHLDFLDFINAGSPSFHTLTIVYCTISERISRLVSNCGRSLKTFQYSSADALSNLFFGHCDLGPN